MHYQQYDNKNILEIILKYMSVTLMEKIIKKKVDKMEGPCFVPIQRSPCLWICGSWLIFNEARSRIAMEGNF